MPADWFEVRLPGAPRTKKNSSNVFPMVTTEGLRNLVARISEALKMEKGGHGTAIRALMSEINFSIHPSTAYKDWFDRCYLYRSSIVAQLTKRGHRLPLTGPVSIKAMFYRDRDSGDALGYEQALADAIQCDEWKCKSCRTKTYVIAGCRQCGAGVAYLEHHRKGLGLIADDNQIIHWDGSRLERDAMNPRIEFRVDILAPAATAPIQTGLFEAQPPADREPVSEGDL